MEIHRPLKQLQLHVEPVSLPNVQHKSELHAWLEGGGPLFSALLGMQASQTRHNSMDVQGHK